MSGPSATPEDAGALSLQGQTAIVTGGAVGLGHAFASALARCGASVTICDIRENVEAIAAELSRETLAVTGIVADVSNPDDVRRAVDSVLQGSERIDILLNNAGVARRTPVTDPWEQSLAEFDSIVGTNFKGSWLFGRAVVPTMISQGSGNIVNIASDHVHTCGWPEPATHREAQSCRWATEHRQPGVPCLDIHDASKWALNGLTQSWAKELRDHGIRVNNLCMGAADSWLQWSIQGYDGPDQVPEDLRAKWLRPEDISRVLLELLAEGPEGRSGDNVGIWVGHPILLGPPSRVLDVSSWISPSGAAPHIGGPPKRVNPTTP